MPQKPSAISLYKVTLLTALFSWLLDTTGAMQRMPRIELFGDDGFWVLHGTLFAAIWLLIAYLERLFGVGSWLRALRSRHGTAAFLDVLVLICCAVTWAAAFGAGTLSQYHSGLLLVLIAAAFQSLASGREPSRVLAPVAAMAPAALPEEPRAPPAEADAALPVADALLASDAPTELLPPAIDAGAPPPLPDPSDASAAAANPAGSSGAADTVRLDQP